MRGKNAFVSLMLCLFQGHYAKADNGGLSDQVQACRKVSADTDRLACYDRLAIATAIPPANAAGAWDIRHEKSQLDDSLSILANLPASSYEIPGSSSFEDEAPYLVIRCSDHKPTIFMGFHNAYLTMASTYNVTYRLDDSAPQKVRWDRSTDFEAAGMWDKARAFSFLKSLETAKKAVIRVDNPHGGYTQGVFNLDGIAKVADEIRSACR